MDGKEYEDAKVTRIVNAHRDGNRFVVRADETLTAFLELEGGALQVRGEFDVVTSSLLELTLVLVRFDHVASRIIDANHSTM